MKRVIGEPELTTVIQEMEMRGLDPVSLLETSPDGMVWRDELDSRDQEILNMDTAGFDYVQIVLSRVVPKFDGDTRETYKTRHLPIEAVKSYIRGRYEGNKRV